MELELVGGFLAILAAIFSAVQFYFVRNATSPKGAINSVIVSFLVGSISFFSVSIILNYPNFRLPKVGAFIFIICGLLEAFSVVFLYEGIRRVGASRSSPIARGSLLISSLIAVLFLGESVKILHFFGIVILAFGVVLVSFEAASNNLDSVSTLSLDLAFPLVAMVLFGVAAPLASLGFSKGLPVTIGLAIQRLIAFTTVLLLFLIRGWHPFRPFRMQERGLYFGAAIAATLFLACFYLALSITPVVVVTPLRGTDPLFVVIISYFYLERLEKITKVLVIGVVLTVLGGALIGIFL